jgi:nuclear pore complex protein Nup214
MFGNVHASNANNINASANGSFGFGAVAPTATPAFGSAPAFGGAPAFGTPAAPFGNPAPPAFGGAPTFGGAPAAPMSSFGAGGGGFSMGTSGPPKRQDGRKVLTARRSLRK